MPPKIKHLNAKDMAESLGVKKIDRRWWEKQKNKAAKAGVDVKVFNRGLGPALDRYQQLCGQAFREMQGPPARKLSPAALVKVGNQHAAILTIVDQYERLCPDAALKQAIGQVGNEVDSMYQFLQK